MGPERVTFLQHGGKQVLLIDFSNVSAKDVSKIIADARPIIRQSELHSLLTLSDMTNVPVGDVSVGDLVTFVRDNKPYVKASAITGVSSLAKAILATTCLLTGRQIMSFESRQQALDWLITVG
jgi:hypothetical protein